MYSNPRKFLLLMRNIYLSYANFRRVQILISYLILFVKYTYLERGMREDWGDGEGWLGEEMRWRVRKLGRE